MGLWFVIGLDWIGLAATEIHPESWIICISQFQLENYFIFSCLTTTKIKNKKHELVIESPPLLLSSILLILRYSEGARETKRREGFWCSETCWVQSEVEFEMESSAVLGGLQPNFPLCPSRNPSSTPLLRPFSTSHSSPSLSVKVQPIIPPTNLKYECFLFLFWIFIRCFILILKLGSVHCFFAAPKAASFGFLSSSLSLSLSSMCHIV